MSGDFLTYWLFSFYTGWEVKTAGFSCIFYLVAI